MATGARIRVLLVDDNAASIALLEKILAPERFEIAGRAGNGLEALKLYQAHKPDLVLMDIVMPVMDGLQALRLILQLDPHAKVVMVSSVAGVGENVAEAMRFGARGMVSKPPQAQELLGLIDKLQVG
jgi:two-component system chemotaxis response regulator CheY